MKHYAHTLLMATVAMLAVALSSCNDEDPFSLPYDMTTQNMMDEDNGKTMMSTTDAYIDRNMNITSNDYFICDYGPVLDLGHVEEADPDILTLTNQAYIQPDEGYLLFKRTDAHRFPSGCVGIASNSTYYRLWVDEWITNDNGKKTGARVCYAQYATRTFGFPEWNSTLATLRCGESNVLAVIPQKDCEIDVDSVSRDAIELKVAGTTRKSTTVSINAKKAGTHTVYVRYKNSFVALRVVVE